MQNIFKMLSIAIFVTLFVTSSSFFIESSTIIQIRDILQKLINQAQKSGINIGTAAAMNKSIPEVGLSIVSNVVFIEIENKIMLYNRRS